MIRTPSTMAIVGINQLESANAALIESQFSRKPGLPLQPALRNSNKFISYGCNSFFGDNVEFRSEHILALARLPRCLCSPIEPNEDDEVEIEALDPEGSGIDGDS